MSDPHNVSEAKHKDTTHTLNSRIGLQELTRFALKALVEKSPSVPDYALPKPHFSDKNSNGLTKAIIAWLQLHGHQAERISVTGRRVDNRQTITDGIGRQKVIGSVKWIRSSMQPGTSDISAVINGKAIKIEIKIGRDQQSEEQTRYQQQIETAGGVYLIVKDFQMFFDWYRKEVDNVEQWDCTSR